VHCSERERLLAHYHGAVYRFTALVGKLNRLDDAGFAGAYADSDRAREECEKARRALNRHTEMHGCGTLSAAAGSS
jgi:hypothetical protein